MLPWANCHGEAQKPSAGNRHGVDYRPRKGGSRLDYIIVRLGRGIGRSTPVRGDQATGGLAAAPVILMTGIVGVILAAAVAANHRRQHAGGASHHVVAHCLDLVILAGDGGLDLQAPPGGAEFRLVTAILIVGTCFGLCSVRRTYCDMSYFTLYQCPSGVQADHLAPASRRIL